MAYSGRRRPNTRKDRPVATGRPSTIRLTSDSLRNNTTSCGKQTGSIVVRAEAFGCGFDVLVPIKGGGPDRSREFRERAEALGYAETIAAETGWPIVDRTGEPS